MRIQTFVIYIEITNRTYLGPFKHNASHGIRLLNRGYHSIPFFMSLKLNTTSGSHLSCRSYLFKSTLQARIN